MPEEMIPKENLVRLLNMQTNPTNCRYCNRKIWYIKMKSEKLNPITDEGLSHFTDCPNANGARNNK